MTEMTPILKNLAFLIAMAGSVGVLFRLLKWPLVIGYLTAGLLSALTNHYWREIFDHSSLEAWAEIGVIFLLFGLGLEFSFKKLKLVGRAALITGTLECSILFFVGFAVGQFLDFSRLQSIFLAAALTISSSSIVMRSLAELGLNKKNFVPALYGVLVVEDLIAIILLVALNAITQGQSSGLSLELIQVLGRLIFLVLFSFAIGIYLVPLALRKIRDFLDGELVLVLSVGLCLMMVFVFTKAGFSAALGAFLMGSILASTPEAKWVEEKVLSVRELFSALFFISIGMLVDPQVLVSQPLLIFSITAILIITKWFAVTLAATIGGQNVKNSIMMGASLIQIGEFSFLIAKLGTTAGVVTQDFFAVIIWVAIFSTLATQPFLSRAKKIAEKIESYLPTQIQTQFIDYQQQLRQTNSKSLSKMIWHAYGLRLILNSIIILGIAVVLKMIDFSTSDFAFAYKKTALCTLFCISSLPFLWALLFGKPKLHKHSNQQNTQNLKSLKSLNLGVTLFRVIFASTLIFLILRQFTDVTASLWMMLALIASLKIAHEPLKIRYEKIETQFVEHLDEKELSLIAEKSKGPRLAPWEAQVTQVTVSPNSALVGLNIKDSALKTKTGVMIAVIERGLKKILAPSASEVFYPHDILYLVGTDQQIEQAQALLTSTNEPLHLQNEDFGLDSICLEKDDFALNKSIRNSEFREKLGALVVGIERGSVRILNPEASEILKLGDTVWLAGPLAKIRDFRWSRGD